MPLAAWSSSVECTTSNAHTVHADSRYDNSRFHVEVKQARLAASVA